VTTASLPGPGIVPVYQPSCELFPRMQWSLRCSLPQRQRLLLSALPLWQMTGLPWHRLLVRQPLRQEWTCPGHEVGTWHRPSV